MFPWEVHKEVQRETAIVSTHISFERQYSLLSRETRVLDDLQTKWLYIQSWLQSPESFEIFALMLGLALLLLLVLLLATVSSLSPRGRREAYKNPVRRRYVFSVAYVE